MSEIEEIKARLDILDIVSENVQLKRSGKNYTGFCPFHANTRTPAFVVWPDTGTWRCFGECGEGGDIFKYVMKRDGLDFPEALRQLAQRAGVELRPPTPQETAQREENDHLRKLLEDATTYFRHQLFNNPAGKVALDYLHERGLSDETIQLFELGYAPPGWESTYPLFLKKGFAQKDLVDAGLASERDDGSLYDRFRHRVIFPIRDSRGRMTGYGARAIDPEDVPKYLNSPQTALFDKSNLLYGLDKARKHIRDKDQVIIVEGYLDVIAPYQAGYSNLVSPMGTALTEEQLRQLKRLTRKFILALDADAAGASATMRGLQVARNTLDRETEMVFDARGLLHSEARLKADIRVSTLPEGKDPDEVVREDPAVWEQIIRDAQPIVAHVMKTLAAGQDINDPKVKTEIAQQVLPLIQDLPNAIERDTYLQQLARLLKIDERSLLNQRRISGGKPPIRRKPQFEVPESKLSQAASGAAAVTSVKAQMVHNLEEHFLSILMREPELIYKIDRALKQADLPSLSTEDFQNTIHQELLEATMQSLDQDQINPVSFALDHIPFQLLEKAEAILEKSEKINPKQEHILEDMLRTILRMREVQLKESNIQIRFLLEDAQENNKTEITQYNYTIQQNSQKLLRIHKALASADTHTHHQ
ncbi:MAG TPA: DNA primase [Anaerolineales bacterium]|jgi:DNA primase|nr:DNA primase [Anaerolineales bacterium]